MYLILNSYCTVHVQAVIIFVIMCGHFGWKRIFAIFFIVCLYLSCLWRFNFQDMEGLDQINRFNPATVLCLSLPGLGFPTPYVMFFFFVLNDHDLR